MDIFTQFPATADNPNGFSREPIPEITDYMSYSRIKTMTPPIGSMAHYKHRYIDGNTPEDTPEKRFGRLLHEALLEPEKFAGSYSVKPDKKKIEGLIDTVADLKAEAKKKKIKLPAGAKKDDIEDLLKKADPFYRTRIFRFILEDYEKNLKNDSREVSQDQLDLILSMMKVIDNSVIKNKKVRDLLKGGTSEVCAYWQDEELGVTWFIRLDYIRVIKLTNDENLFWITDLKTTKDASPDGFRREIANLAYHLQNWIYHRVVRGITGAKVNLTNVALEKAVPIGVGVYNPEQRAWDTAAWQVRRTLEKFRWCQSIGRWPKYEENIVELGPPNWYYWNIEQQADLEGENA